MINQPVRAKDYFRHLLHGFPKMLHCIISTVCFFRVDNFVAADGRRSVVIGIRIILQ